MIGVVLINFFFFAIGMIIGASLVFKDAIDNGVCRHLGNKHGFMWIKRKEENNKENNKKGDNNEI